jgi:hypothetical protein
MKKTILSTLLFVFALVASVNAQQRKCGSHDLLHSEMHKPDVAHRLNKIEEHTAIY